MCFSLVAAPALFFLKVISQNYDMCLKVNKYLPLTEQYHNFEVSFTIHQSMISNLGKAG